MAWNKYRASLDVPVVPPQQNTEGRRPITLFFTTEGTRLAREAREIEPCADDDACLREVVTELLHGPVGAFGVAIPEGTVVVAAHSEGPLATIEFNRTFADAMISGSSAEMLAVYSVVNTVAVNFPHIQTVKITIEGNGESTLSHLDLSDPLPPDYSLEQSPSPERERTAD
jgi:spore germination protein GerM